MFSLVLSVLLFTGFPVYGSDKVSSQDALTAQWITIPDLFTDLERGPVKFPHDRHTDALDKKSCSTCHQTDPQESLSFSFPKNPNIQNRDALTNSYHDACIGCHQERRDLKLSTGPDTCGECHIAEQKLVAKTYQPRDTAFYTGLQDTYHQDCLQCHDNNQSKAKTAEELDWKSFYIKVDKNQQVHWPKSNFNNALHNKHEKALENQCENCHYLSPQTIAKLQTREEEPGCRDWLKEKSNDGGFSDQKSAHLKCIGCHLENDQVKANQLESKSKVSNIYCRDCHQPSQKALTAKNQSTLIECNQKEKLLIQSEKQPSMGAVSFNHDSHQTINDNCQSCHHNTLDSCSDCHQPIGIAKGENITLYEAYHAKSTALSCIGCHETEKKQADCSGCHESITQHGQEDTCVTCHSGTLDQITKDQKLPDPKTLITESTQDDFDINLLKNEYKGAWFPHLAMAKKLTEIANNSQLASFFHTKPTTVCQTCHHNAPVTKDVKPPKCATCHTTRNEPFDAIPTLLGAYHQDCLGCHKEMSTDERYLPQECSECHQPNLKAQSATLKKK
jgi:hypothetical protein